MRSGKEREIEVRNQRKDHRNYRLRRNGKSICATTFWLRMQGDCYDKYKVDYSNENAQEVSLEELKLKADIISIHLPYSEETHYYVDKPFINSCQKPFYLINTARGQHVKISDLIHGLESGKILGACLDVLEFEKSSFEKLNANELPESWQKLVASDKVVLSPHVAGWTVESYVKLSTFLGEKIVDRYM